MIVLDTNVPRNSYAPRPNEPAVVRWTASQSLDTLFTTTVTQAEMLYGVKLLPIGQRRQQLEEAATALFEEDFIGRIPPFDGGAATAYAEVAADRKRNGRSMS